MPVLVAVTSTTSAAPSPFTSLTALSKTFAGRALSLSSYQGTWSKVVPFHDQVVMRGPLKVTARTSSAPSPSRSATRIPWTPEPASPPNSTGAG